MTQKRECCQGWTYRGLKLQTEQKVQAPRSAPTYLSTLKFFYNFLPNKMKKGTAVNSCSLVYVILIGAFLYGNLSRNIPALPGFFETRFRG